ncbi:hypothetical protein BHE74_00026040 [Ensete ventricosum]|nr:hypothetical protein BHE74_00026040 [Ensete ventricosum]
MLNICVDTARQQRQHRRRCKMMKGPPYTCISVDNDAGKDGAALHLYWHRCRSRAALMQLLSDTDVDAEHLQLRHHLSSHHRFPSLSIIATRDPSDLAQGRIRRRSEAFPMCTKRTGGGRARHLHSTGRGTLLPSMGGEDCDK